MSSSDIASPDLGIVRPDVQSSSGHNYPAIQIGGNAHVHLGDQHFHGIHQSRGLDDTLETKLFFAEIHQRYQSIKESSSDTCEWMLQLPRLEKGRPAPRWDCFRSWLDHGTSIYWVSGKPGSGKSTLVKFLYDHVSEDEAGILNRPTVILSFWFWEAGTELQRSTVGCYRSLLWQILRHPLSKEIAKSTLLPLQTSNVPWTESHLRESLKITIDAIHKRDVPILIFLDGLDESGEDAEAILEGFKQILKDTPCLKICVSSRPEQRFRDWLAAYPCLRLQDLNEDDIRKVISEDFLAKPLVAKLLEGRPQVQRKLENSLQAKTDGVFLWVHLAIRSLIRGLTNRDSLETLESRLEDLPPDLNKMYTQMLARSSGDTKYYAREAALYFALVINDEMSLLDFCLAINDRCRTRFLNPPFDWSTTGLHAELHCSEAEIWIQTRSGGLLEVSDISFTLGWAEEELQVAEGTPSWLWKSASCRSVSFIHRTARDYVLESNNEVRDLLSTPATSIQRRRFEVYLITYNILLALHSGPLFSCGIDDNPLPPCTDDLLLQAKIVWDRLAERGLLEVTSLYVAPVHKPVEKRGFLQNSSFTYFSLIPSAPFPAYPDGEIDFGMLFCLLGWHNQAQREIEDRRQDYDPQRITLLLLSTIWRIPAEKISVEHFALMEYLLNIGADPVAKHPCFIARHSSFMETAENEAMLGWAGDLREQFFEMLRQQATKYGYRSTPDLLCVHVKLHLLPRFEPFSDEHGIAFLGSYDINDLLSIPAFDRSTMFSGQCSEIFVISIPVLHRGYLTSDFFAISKLDSKRLLDCVRHYKGQTNDRFISYRCRGMLSLAEQDLGNPAKIEALINLTSLVKGIVSHSQRLHSFASALHYTGIDWTSIKRFAETWEAEWASRNWGVDVKAWRAWFWGPSQLAKMMIDLKTNSHNRKVQRADAKEPFEADITGPNSYCTSNQCGCSQLGDAVD